jgi:isoquinoline 1-oxidoreductase beta subunit
MKVKGVKKVVKTERKMPHRAVEAVAVVADTYWAALKARKALKIQWDAEGSDKISTDAYYANLRQLAQTRRNRLSRKSR